MSKRAIVIAETDNVANLVGEGRKGEQILVDSEDASQTFQLATDIPPNHKFAITQIRKGQDIIKYGLRIGLATSDIAIGEHVHAHNIDSLRAQSE
jgi:altronate dehydratase small subunit